MSNLSKCSEIKFDFSIPKLKKKKREMVQIQVKLNELGNRERLKQVIS